MHVYIIISERDGIYEFQGFCLSEEEVERKKKGVHHPIVLREEVDEKQLLFDEIYVAGAYDLSPEHPDYRGIYYSLEQAREAAGNPSFIYALTLPVKAGLQEAHC
ncbi:MAG: hypothetical protein KatS3mg031_0119 [Chitinophagales bacterium]|nr:MAG: hypothetical protein KatS3mg031_0119 [Chitinophagales bacterium]